jgi:hypothetical protein
LASEMIESRTDLAAAMRWFSVSLQGRWVRSEGCHGTDPSGGSETDRRIAKLQR